MKTPQLIILGSIALDDIETPFGKKKKLLGGSASYAAYSASFFSRTGIISIVGKDLPRKYWKLFSEKGIDTTGVQRGDKTFRWEGFYEYDMSTAKTLCTELNSLASFRPYIPDCYRDARFVFLGNSHPVQQMEVINQLAGPKVIAMDTMNLWIEHTREYLIDVIKRVKILILNDSEARELFNTPTLVKAAKEALKLGPEYVIIKKGEHGAVMFTGASVFFSAPGYPLEDIKDPTGCGDCFGGGLMGYLAAYKRISLSLMRRGVIYGSVCASYNAGEFGMKGIIKMDDSDIENRYREFKAMRHF